MTDFQIPRLHLISNRSVCPLERFPAVAELAVDGGVDAIHLREKELSAGATLTAACEIRDKLEGRARLFINDRVDVAMISNAGGVQLGESSLPVQAVRQIVGKNVQIGRSVHDLDGAKRAAAVGADFIIAGHVFETASKFGQPGRGLSFLAKIVEICSIPVIAIGGITPERVPDVIAAGAHGVAVISGILSSTDPAEAAKRYRVALENGT